MMQSDTWNEFVLTNNGSFLQSTEWGMLQESLGVSVSHVRKEEFQSILIRKKLFLGKSFLYAPRGPVFNTKFEQKEVLQKFIIEAKKDAEAENASFIRIEPNLPHSKELVAMLKDLGFKKADQMQPEETQVLDLTKPEEELKKELAYKVRYAIRTAERRGVEIDIATIPVDKNDQFKEFWRIFNATNSYHKIKAYPRAYYERIAQFNSDCCKTIIISAKHDKHIISSAMFLFFNDTALYLYSGSLRGFGRFNAPSAVLWAAIKYAIQNSYKTFDFWGVSQKNKNWAQLSTFKKSFGGKEISYIGTWDYPIDRLTYAMYRFLRHIPH